jgi:hypothetical protein
MVGENREGDRYAASAALKSASRPSLSSPDRTLAAWVVLPDNPPQRVADRHRRHPRRLSSQFEEFCTYLKVEKGAAPRTITANCSKARGGDPGGIEPDLDTGISRGCGVALRRPDTGRPRLTESMAPEPRHHHLAAASRCCSLTAFGRVGYARRAPRTQPRSRRIDAVPSLPRREPRRPSLLRRVRHVVRPPVSVVRLPERRQRKVLRRVRQLAHCSQRS